MMKTTTNETSVKFINCYSTNLQERTITIVDLKGELNSDLSSDLKSYI